MSLLIKTDETQERLQKILDNMRHKVAVAEGLQSLNLNE